MVDNHKLQVDWEIELLQSRLQDIESTAYGMLHGFKPAVSLKTQLNSVASKFSISPLNNSAGVFMIKTVLDALDRYSSTDRDSAGVPISERTIRSIFATCCQELSIKLNIKGGITGLGLDVATVCSVLHIIGITKLLTEAEVNSFSLSNVSSSSSSSNGHTVANSSSSSSGASTVDSATSCSSSSSSTLSYRHNSLIVSSFISRWGDVLAKYLRVLKETAEKQSTLAAEANAAVAVSANAVTDTGEGEAVGVPIDEPDNVGAVVVKAQESQQIMNVLDHYAQDVRQWSMRSNEALSTVDLAAVLEGGGEVHGLSVLTTPKETLAQYQHVVYAEALAQETEEYLIRRLLTRCGVDINTGIGDSIHQGSTCVSQIPYFRLGTRYLHPEFVYHEPKPLAPTHTNAVTGTLANESSSAAAAAGGYPHATQRPKTLKKMRQEMRMAKAAAKALAVEEKKSVRGRVDGHSNNAVDGGMHSFAYSSTDFIYPPAPVTAATSQLSSIFTSSSMNMAQVFQKSMANGSLLNAHMLMDKARKIKKHKDTTVVQLDELAERYHTATSIYSDNNVGASVLSVLKQSSSNLSKLHKKRTTSLGGGGSTSTLEIGSLLSSSSVVKKRKSHLLLPTPIQTYAGMTVLPTGVENNLYATTVTLNNNNSSSAAASSASTVAMTSSSSSSSSSSAMVGGSRSGHMLVTNAGHILLPDLVIRTTEIPWSLVANEFVTLDYSEELGDNNVLQRCTSGQALAGMINNSNNNSSAHPGLSPSVSVGNLNHTDPTDRKRTIEFEPVPQSAMKRSRSGSLKQSPSKANLLGGDDSSSMGSSFPRVELKRQVSVVVAPQFDEIPPTMYAKYPSHVKHGRSSALNASARSVAIELEEESLEEEDISDDVMLAKHEAVLSKMREKWTRPMVHRGGNVHPEMESYIVNSSNSGNSVGVSQDVSTPVNLAVDVHAKTSVKALNMDGEVTPRRSGVLNVKSTIPMTNSSKKPRGRPTKGAK